MQLTVPMPTIVQGAVVKAHAGLLYARLPISYMLAACKIERFDGSIVHGQVIGFNGDTATIAPFGTLEGITPGSKVSCITKPLQISIPENPAGCVLDPVGAILYENRPRTSARSCSINLMQAAPAPMERQGIRKQLVTGIRAIDTFCPLGLGQRLGLFAEPGCGKSTLLGTIAQQADATVIVIALVGERGREIQEFVFDTLGEAGLCKTTVVVAPSDAPALYRQYAAYTATAVAEYYRNQGQHVLLLVDSLTRTARALREVNLAAGELPVRQGYTPGVYAELPRLIERSGMTSSGSITAVYTVLTNGQNQSDALTEELISLLDGHIHLSAEHALRGIYPALDPVTSLSRLGPRLLPEATRMATIKIRKALCMLQNDRELAQLGGTPSAELTAALRMENKIIAYCSQKAGYVASLQESHTELIKLAAELDLLITESSQ